MADPFSITVAVVGLLKTSYTIGSELKKFQNGVSTVRNTINGLVKDVDSLSNVLETMRDTFEGITAEYGTGNVASHWTNVTKALQDGQGVLSQLSGKLQEVNKTTKFLAEHRKQLRLKFAAEQINTFRDQIQSYRDTLQLSLQAIILWYQVSESNLMDKLLPTLGDMHQEIRRIAERMNQRIEALQSKVETDDQAANVDVMQHLRECVKSAASLVSSASTAKASEKEESEALGLNSDFGDCFPHRENFALQRWQQSPSIHDYTDPGHIAGPTFPAAVPFYDDSDGGSDSDVDLEDEIAFLLLNTGKEKLATGDKKAAEKLLQSSLKRLYSQSTIHCRSKSSRRILAYVDVMDTLFHIYEQQERWLDAHRIFSQKMALKQRSSIKDDAGFLDDTLTLARLSWRKGDLTEAQLQARRAFKGHKKLQNSAKMRTCLTFLVELSEADQNDDHIAFSIMLAKMTPQPTDSNNAGGETGTDDGMCINEPRSPTSQALGSHSNRDDIRPHENDQGFAFPWHQTMSDQQVVERGKLSEELVLPLARSSSQDRAFAREEVDYKRQSTPFVNPEIREDNSDNATQGTSGKIQGFQLATASPEDTKSQPDDSRSMISRTLRAHTPTTTAELENQWGSESSATITLPSLSETKHKILDSQDDAVGQDQGYEDEVDNAFSATFSLAFASAVDRNAAPAPTHPVTTAQAYLHNPRLWIDHVRGDLWGTVRENAAKRALGQPRVSIDPESRNAETFSETDFQYDGWFYEKADQQDDLWASSREKAEKRAYRASLTASNEQGCSAFKHDGSSSNVHQNDCDEPRLPILAEPHTGPAEGQSSKLTLSVPTAESTDDLRLRISTPTSTTPTRLPTAKWYQRTEPIDDPGKQCRKLVIVGDSCCGKTLLLMSQVNGTGCISTPAPTIACQQTKLYSARQNTWQELDVWDTCGHDEYLPLRKLGYHDANLVMICFAVDARRVFDNVEEKWREEAYQNCPWAPIVLVGCRVDSRTDENEIGPAENNGQTPISQKEGQEMSDRINAVMYMECSAVTGQGVSDLFDFIGDLLFHEKKKSTWRRFGRRFT